MAFEDIKLRGLTFAERSELIKAELDPLYTPLPEETPEPAKLLWYRVYYVLVTLHNGLCNTSTA